MIAILIAAVVLMTFASLLLFWPRARSEAFRAELQGLRRDLYTQSDKYGLLDSPAYCEAENRLQKLIDSNRDITIAWFYAAYRQECDAPKSEVAHPLTEWFELRLAGVAVTHVLANTFTGLILWSVISVGVPKKLAAFYWGVARMQQNVRLRTRSLSQNVIS